MLNVFRLDENTVNGKTDLDPSKITQFKVRLGKREYVKNNTRPELGITLEKEKTSNFKMFHWNYKRIVSMDQKDHETFLRARYEARITQWKAN